MRNTIRISSAAVLLVTALSVHAAGPAPEPKAEPAGAPLLPNVRDPIMWPPELMEGRRAWARTELMLPHEADAKPTRNKVPAGAELRLVKSRYVAKKDWWVVEAVASDVRGLARPDDLTRDWPKGDADTLVPMLGDRSAEIERLRFLLSNPSFKVRIDAYQQLHRYSGITDEKLFDALAVHLVQGLDGGRAAEDGFWWQNTVWGAQIARASPPPAAGRYWAKEVIWLTKALASSGYSKYRPPLERAAERGRGHIDGHANVALDELENYARWNRIINDPSNHKPGQSHESTRLQNMINSSEPQLQRAGTSLMAQLSQPAVPASGVQADASPWEAKFQVGRRARAMAEVGMRRAPTAKAFAKLAAGAAVRLLGREDHEGAEWWEVQPIGSRNQQSGWVPRTALTQQWPAGPADRPVPMLGDRGAEIDAIITRLRDGDSNVRIQTTKDLYLSGITDERVFDTIAQVLAAGFAQSTQVGNESTRSLWPGISAGLLAGPGGQAAAPRINQRTWPREPAWLVKALGYSGHAKYRPLIELAAESDEPGSTDLADHASAALGSIELHAFWNRVINDPRNARPGRPDEVARLLNMLQSGERELVRSSVNQTIRAAGKSPELTDAIEAELLKSYALDLDSDAAETASLMAKALGNNPKYEATLITVAHKAKSFKLRRYANAGVPPEKQVRIR